MLEILILGLIYGFIAAGLAFAWIVATNYGSMFGKIRYWIALKLEDELDRKEREDIFKERITASAQAGKLNEDYYGFVAKHSWFFFLITCKYCFGTWILIALIIFAFPYYDFQMILASVSSLYVTLYLTNPNTIIIKP